MRITRIRYYADPGSRPIFNQSSNLVTVETDQGITGIGEGGSRDTIVQCAAMLIGEDPGRIEHLWQLMYRGYFYPAGREKLHALGALDLALWDIKGKAAFPGPVLMEMTGAGPRAVPHLPWHFDFSRGKLWPNRRPGLGVEFDPKPLQMIAEVTERSRPIRIFQRPDGSITNW